ncbi:uncharacterized protein KGF55_005406 [Candida pseudojiufengensis]|uniref:uncharacterized protein n=1 Tax=Candida pseudojiufengensis TaxID=497109 RepID=UPI002225A669|nr:uncharacterized protein KGF55_005406 [Candida pseudojiufengensis]KAI5959428.1 hypothetical protein KGF55_005406 [Candida pseudojiufengensis]
MIISAILIQFVLSITVALNIIITSTDNWCSSKTRRLQQHLMEKGHNTISISPLYQQNLNLEIPETFKIGNNAIKNGGEYGHLKQKIRHDSTKYLGKRGAKQVIFEQPEEFITERYNFQSFESSILNNQYGQDPENFNAWYTNSNAESMINIAFNTILPKFYPEFKVDLVIIGPNDDNNNDNVIKNMLNDVNVEHSIHAIGISTKDKDTMYFKDLKNKSILQKNIDLINQITTQTIVQNLNKLTTNDNKLSLFIKFPSLNYKSSICRTPESSNKNSLSSLLDYQTISQRNSIGEKQNYNELPRPRYVMESNGKILKIEDEIPDEFDSEEDLSKNYASFQFKNAGSSIKSDEPLQQKSTENHSERSLNDIKEYILMNCNIAVEVLNPINPFKLKKILSCY